MIRHHAVVIALVVLATPAAAQDLGVRPSITVVGRGHVETPPDTFQLSAELQGRGTDQVAALRALADAKQRVTDIERLDGLRAARLTTGAPNVAPSFDPACGAQGYGRDTADCPVVGYVASISLMLEASPVERAGDALSLASERDARNARVDSFFLRDDQSQSVEAQREAFADARRQAEALAAAAGQRIVRVLKLENPDADRLVARYAAPVAEVVVTGGRASPSVRLDVAPPPVRTEARVVATFEIE